MSNNTQDDFRKEFLLKMYSELCNEINRSIQLVWQAVGVLVGAFAIFAFVEKNIIPIDIAVSLMFLLSAWMAAHIINSNYWYNRNLAMIANIEKQFLIESDLKDIHYYFGRHRESKSMLQDLKIQSLLNIGVVVIMLLYHLSTRVIPCFGQPITNIEFERCIPYIVLVSAAFYIFNLRKRLIKEFDEFKANSPGKQIDTSAINYGFGHPVDK